MNDAQAKYVADSVVRYRNLFQKVFDNESRSRSRAVKAMCVACVGQEDVASRVGNCTVDVCPLWNWRPFRSKDNSREQE